MGFDVQLNQEDCGCEANYWCLKCNTQMKKDKDCKEDNLKFKCPRCGAVFNTGY